MGVRTKTGGSSEAASVGALKSLRDGSSSRRVKNTSRKSDDFFDKGEEKVRSSKRMKENDVAELLLGLAHSAVPPSVSPEGRRKGELSTASPSQDVKEHIVERSGDTGTEHEPKPGADVSTKRVGIDAAGLQHLTSKGHVRLGPGDNRVRPPKAATKLLNSKWRHIRLPTVQAALEAEDWVVMFCHLRNPEVLDKDRVISMLNFEQSYYNEREVKEKLQFIVTAFDLENFLKDRYCGNSQKKSRVNDESKRRKSLHQDQGKASEISLKIYRDLESIVDSYVSTQTAKSLNEFASQQNASAADPGKGVQQDLTNKSIPAGRIRRKDSTNSTEKSNIATHDSNEDGKGRVQFPNTLEYGNGHFMEYGMGLPWTMLQNPSTVADSGKGIMATGAKSDVGRNVISGNAVNHVLGPFPSSGDLWIQSYMKFLNSSSNLKEPGKRSLKLPVKEELQDEKDAKTKSIARIEEQADMAQEVPRGESGIERPGRPPSYDGMVKWCVDLKRFLSQKDVMLTIEDVIPLVNNKSIYDAGTQAKHKKSLVGSTLRKRVVGIYGISWSQVATSEDKDLHKKITNANIMHAAKILMDRKGFNANGRTAGMSDEAIKNQAIALEDSQSLGDGTDKKLGRDVQQHNRQGGSHDSKVQNSTKDKGEAIICVPQNIPESPELSHIIRKSKHQFLAFEEVALLLKSASQGILPVSLQVNYRPCSGTLYLINRSKVAKFRCDGYHFRKRETHTRKLLPSKEKLNCYYAGGPGDEIQRRSYWLLTESNEEAKDSSNRLQDIVLIHYIERKSQDGDDEVTKLMFEKSLLEQKIAEINQKLNG